MTETEPLCCCEYITREGERSHILGLCCDCAALDEAVDSLVTGGGVKSHLIPQILDLAEERLRIPWRGGALKVPLAKTFPLVLVPGLLWFSSLHQLTAAITFLGFLPCLACICVRVIARHRPHTKFFLYCSYTTAATLLYVYEVKCVGTFWDLPKLISWWENLVLVVGMVLMFLTHQRLRTEPSYSSGRMCRVCEVRVEGRDHHCVWLDLCVSQSNLNTFLAFISVTSFTCSHLALLLTSYACPGQVVGPLLLPSACWPHKPNDRLLLVSGLLSAVLALLLGTLLIGHGCRRVRSSLTASDLKL